MTKWLYHFEEAQQLKPSDRLRLLGGKGASLVKLSELGLPTPAGFTLTTQACSAVLADDRKNIDEIFSQTKMAMLSLEAETGRPFAGYIDPLLVSVRSGAEQSMPGMMDTFLDVGMCTNSADGLRRKFRNPEMAFGTILRFCETYLEDILNLDSEDYELPTAPSEDFSAFENINSVIFETHGRSILSDLRRQSPINQLMEIIEAVFKSVNSSRAQTFRLISGITEAATTAVTVQAMVYGNANKKSASGVVLTRNPHTGEKQLYGEAVLQQQGEMLVSGKSTPIPFTALNRKTPNFEKKMPAIYEELQSAAVALEAHYLLPQEIEFTVERGELWLLQTREAKCSPVANIQMAADMVAEGLIDKAAALSRAKPYLSLANNQTRVKQGFDRHPIMSGIAAVGGAIAGYLAFSESDIQQLKNENKKAILVRPETSPHDVGAIEVADAVLTQKGGATSHAAVIAQAMMKPCIVGANQIEIDEAHQQLIVAGRTYSIDSLVTLDGSSGLVFNGEMPMEKLEPSLAEKTLKSWL